MQLSVVIPTLREFESLSILIPELKKHLDDLKLEYEIIIVDDESEAPTKSLVKEYSPYLNISIISQDKKAGLGRSALTGFKAAKGKILLLMDGDGSHNPRYIARMIEPIKTNEYEITVGSRYLNEGRIRQWNIFRILISKFAAYLARPICNISDPASGFIAFKKDVISLEDINPLSWKIGLEIFGQRPKSIKEVPIIFENRYAGKSKFNIIAASEFVYHLLRIYFLRYRFSVKK